jgi:threonine synthase
MKYYSTQESDKSYSLQEAVLKGLPDDNGLFMPESIPVLPFSFFNNLSDRSFKEISFDIAAAFLKDDVPEEIIEKIINSAITFPAPVIPLDAQTGILELFHGPTLAFKDFGAGFMAGLMSYFVRNQNTKLTILVATSGDTGGAVAKGFYKTDGIEVIILYPSGKVSGLQEKQLTTLGENITAIEVDGTFDDCQRMVKTAFHDGDLLQKYQLSSANSINISRLIPQSFYYFESWKQVQHTGKQIVFSVPSGNFGNLTAGVFAKKMGLPVAKFIAAVNSNDVFTQYIKTGNYHPHTSVRTLSNAMDVGAPSNFARLMSVYQESHDKIKSDIASYSFDDAATAAMIVDIYNRYHYITDPHGAVALSGAESFRKEHPGYYCIALGTAHPAKFAEEMRDILHFEIPVPESLSSLADKSKQAFMLKADFTELKTFLLSR